MDPPPRSGDEHVVRRIALVLAASASSISGGAACRPPPLPPGFVSTAPGVPRQVDLAVAGAGGTINGDPQAALGGGALSVEPYATPRVSVPIEVGSGGAAGGGVVGLLATRVGVRGRVHPHVSVGGGLGTAALLYVDDETKHLAASPISGTFDLEVAASARFGAFAISGVARPTVVVTSPDGWELYGLLSVSPAWYATPRVALTGHVVGGPYTYDGDEVGGVIGGGVGLFVHL